MEFLFPLVDRQEIAKETMVFTLSTEGHDYQFQPGQHTDYTLIDPPQTDDEGNTRTFSFISVPGIAKIQFATRMRPSAFKNSLRVIPLGSSVKVKEPMGRFTLHQDQSAPAVFLIGGIGITPVMSILRSLQASQRQRLIYLFYSNPSLATAAFYAELTNMVKDDHELHFIPAFTDEIPENWPGETGRIDATMIKNHLPNSAGVIFYSSGPPAMVKAMVALAEDLGATDERIKTEDFAGY